jgi:KUP system potassium uptake protein
MTIFATTEPVSDHRRPLGAAMLACMGIVFGDIGTSPLYTLAVTVKAASPAGTIAPAAVLGIVSLIFWSLIVVISIKYALLIMRASNHGEGGILALLALISPQNPTRRGWRAAMIIVGLIGATLLYGDGTITPAISVLSAIEGLKLDAPQMGRFVVPLTLFVLVSLFLIQRKGTSWIGRLFGPIMLIWFLIIGVLGIIGIAKAPAILAALSPLPAITYLWHAGPLSLVIIGGAFLAVTGGEAFYADMGHFGPRPIRLAWFTVALPALTLNYFGQGGLLLTHPEAIDNLFYQLAPAWAHYGLVAFATMATVIASQAIISGAFSLTSQAIKLGFLPRMNIVHTAGHEMGQIYIPLVNWLLALGTLAAVIGFGSSDALAGAYGIAVSLLMAITTILATFVALEWKINPFLVLATNGSLLALEALFVTSTSTKLFDGGWVPLAISGAVAFLMLTWRKGEEAMDAIRLAIREKTPEFIARITARPPHPIPGTVVVLGRTACGVPLSLTRNVNFNHVLHERVLLVSIEMTETPRVSDENRIVVTAALGQFTRIALRYGFMEQADVPAGLQVGINRGQIAPCDLTQVTYFTGHETISHGIRQSNMPQWQKAIFALMSHNAQKPGTYFKLPSDQVMEIGVEFEL